MKLIITIILALLTTLAIAQDTNKVDANGKKQGYWEKYHPTGYLRYKGQFKNDIYHGYGRYIYSNGNFYIGMWQDGKRSGWGKLVDKSGKIYEGMWQYSKFVGN